MISYLNIGGRERPVAFGHAVAYDYEANTGNNYNALLMTVAQMFVSSAEAVAGPDGVPDLEIEAAAILMSEQRRNAVATFSVKPLTDVVYFGMLYAHRRERVEVDFEASDVAEWVFGDTVAMAACMRLLMESLPQNQDAGAKKKPQSPANRNASTGKNSSKPQR